MLLRLRESQGESRVVRCLLKAVFDAGLLRFQREVHIEVASEIFEGELKGLVKLPNIQLDRLTDERPQTVLSQVFRLNDVCSEISRLRVRSL